MSENITRYDELLDELRVRYKRKYNKTLDDEILYIIIRLNEMQLDQKRDFLLLRKDLARKPKVAFNRGKDYFFYGMGQAAGSLIIWVVILLVCASLLFLLRR